MELSEFKDIYICCRRIWTPPANAVGTFYPKGNEWRFTGVEISQTCYEGDWSSSGNYVPATVFADFTPPHEKRPYCVDRGVVVKDGAK